MIKLSVREMAQYIVSDEDDRIELLRKRKYLSLESIARVRFYSESRRSITAYHRGAISRDSMEAKIIAMRDEARHCTPFQRTELLSNADVLERYMYYQGHRSLHLAPAPAADLVCGEVEVAVRPSLFAIEDDDQRRLIFLELREKFSLYAMRIIAELAFAAFRHVLPNLPARAIQVIDVRRGVVTELQQAGIAIRRELSDACRSISLAWPQLTPIGAAQPPVRDTERQLAIAWDFET